MKSFSNRFKNDISTGFGTNSKYSGGRFFNRNGNANVERIGVSILNRYSWYHTLLAMPRTKFLLLLFLIYIGINLIFALLYYMIGVEHLDGVDHSSAFKNFTDVFFFSTQTFTTVGYGRISPVGFLTSALATFEAFLGLLSFAIATGLFYGRFSRPRAFLKFSSQAIIAPYKDGIALMLRMSPFKNNHLSEAEVKLTFGLQEDQDGNKMNRFYSLPTEITKINSLALSWTIVHPIDEKSPLYGLTKKELEEGRAEILVFVKAFDEVFSSTVMTRSSYTASEIKWGAKYKIMYYPSEDGTKTILDLTKLDDIEEVILSQEHFDKR